MAEPPRHRPVRVAVATDDDALDVQRFGHATRFVVYEVAGGEARVVETRDTMPACGSAPGRHEERLDRAVAVVGDCQAMIAREVGPGAAAALHRRGLHVHLASGAVAKALDFLFARNRAPAARRPGGPA